MVSFNTEKQTWRKQVIFQIIVSAGTQGWSWYWCKISGMAMNSALLSPEGDTAIKEYQLRAQGSERLFSFKIILECF